MTRPRGHGGGHSRRKKQYVPQFSVVEVLVELGEDLDDGMTITTVVLYFGAPNTVLTSTRFSGEHMLGCMAVAAMAAIDMPGIDWIEDEFEKWWAACVDGDTSAGPWTPLKDTPLVVGMTRRSVALALAHPASVR